MSSQRKSRSCQAVLLLIACLVLSLPAPAQESASAGPPQTGALPESPKPGFSQDSSQGASQVETDLRMQLATDPDSVPALTGLAALLEQEGHARPAVELWRRAAALRPHDPGLQQSLAQALMDAGRDREAIPILQALTAEHPDLAPAQLALGLALAREEQFSEAIAPLEAALRLRPDDDAAELSLAKVFITLLRFDEAAPHVRTYAARHPVSLDAHYLLGLIASKSGQTAQAERELAAASALDPANYEVQMSLGRVLTADRQLTLAVQHFQAAAALRPSAPEPHYELSRIYRELADKQRSNAELARMKTCREQQSVDRQVSVLQMQAAEAFAKAEYAEALQAYLAAIALRPGEARLHENLALTYGHLGRESEQQAELDKAAALDPRDASILSLKGELAARAGDAGRARTLFDQALGLDADNAAALCGLGVLAAQSGDLGEGERLLERSIESDPAYSEGYRNLGLVLAAEKRYPEAEVALHRSLDGKAEDALAWTALGRVAVEQGKLPDAVRAFTSAVGNASACSLVRVDLAAALAGQADYDAALAALEPVKDSCPGAAEAHLERARILCVLHHGVQALQERKTAQRLNPSEAVGKFQCQE